jgi:hypothetical protein
MEHAHDILFGKREGTRSLGEDLGVDGKIIGKGLREIGCEGVDWIHLAQDRDQWGARVP